MRVKVTMMVLVSLAFGLGMGIFIAGISRTGNEQVTDYEYLAKRAQIADPNIPQVNFAPLRKELETLSSVQTANGETASIYFEYLPSGISININEQNEAIGASLMKVPAVMSLYKSAEDGKTDLDKKIPLREEWLNSDYGELYKKGAGYELSLREAAGYTLRDSDNTAIIMIFDEINRTGFASSSATDAISFLDLEYDTDDGQRVLIGPRSYSSILKCLYLACYNNKDNSQQILENLTQSSFVNRLTAEIPKEVPVAHKIGTYSTEYQSDCGIFYVPKQNYLLCVMVKGSDPEASSAIASISARVYNYIKTSVPQSSE